MENNNLIIGDKVRFHNENGMYRVRSVNDRYAICTQPFNFKRTVLYTILDFENEVRSTNSFVFNPYDYKEDEDVQKCMEDLLSGECELSRRNQIELFITETKKKKQRTNEKRRV